MLTILIIEGYKSSNCGKWEVSKVGTIDKYNSTDESNNNTSDDDEFFTSDEENQSRYADYYWVAVR